MAVFKEYLNLIITCISLLSSLIVTIVFTVKRVKALKNAKTSEDKTKVLDEIKSHAIGFINVAENLFSEVPKSGSSKLLYVIDHIDELCKMNNVEFDEEFWVNFVNGIVAGSNTVQDQKEMETQRLILIDNVKNQIPFFVSEADKLFETIPDNEPYKIEYILKLVKTACEDFTVNVYDEEFWKQAISNYYVTKKAG